MTDDRLNTGGAFDALPDASDRLVARLRGRVLSGYEIGDVIGSGGMGYVLHATRAEGDFEREAAVKVVPASLGTSGMADRFQTEVRILGRLNHPSIAQLYDAGQTDEGWPYLVMEYVDGKPIDEYCAASNLDVDARVELLVKVVRAVRFAHARLIVHRDLKPSNVLVDENGRPKLLDFGIAKLLEPGTPEHTVGHRPMTPQYASPEQLLGADITIGSDIYQLGILALAVIAGETPLESVTLQEAIRNAAAGNDASIPDRAARQVPADLLAIISRCLHSDPEDRYTDVNELLSDLRRYQQGFPVEARRGTRLYRLRKFVQRNLPATLIALVAVSIIVGGTAWYTISLADARRLAEQRADTSERVLQALSSLVTETFEGFIDHNAERQVGTAAVVEAVLEDTANLLREELADEPGARSQLLRVQANIERALGNFPAAAASLDGALRLARGGSAPDVSARLLLDRAEIALQMRDIDTGRLLLNELNAEIDSGELSAGTRIDFYHIAGRLAADESRYDEALVALDSAIALSRNQSQPDNRKLASIYVTQTRVHEDRNDNEALLESAATALDLLEDTESAYSSRRIDPLRRSARAHVMLGDLDAARSALEEAMDIATGNFGDTHVSTALVHHTYGLLEYYSKNLQRAVEHVEEEVRILEALYGPQYPRLTNLRGNLGVLYTDIGETEQAGEMIRSVVDNLDQSAAEDRHAFFAQYINDARRLRAIGDYEGAIERERQRLQIASDLFGPDSIQVADAEDDIALALHSLGRYEEARQWFDASVEKYRAHYGEASDEYRDKLLYYWRYDIVDGDLVAARDKLHELMMEDIERDEVDAIWPVHMFTDLAHLNLRLGDMDRAEQALEWAKTGAATAPRHPWARYTELVEAEIRLAQGRYELARRSAEAALEGMTERFPKHTARIERARNVLESVARTEN